MSDHCPGCEDSGFEDCPGVTCAACAEKDAEIARIRAYIRKEREQIAKLVSEWGASQAELVLEIRARTQP